MSTPYLSEHTGVVVDDGTNKARATYPLFSITALTGGAVGSLDGVDVADVATGTTVNVVIAGVLSVYQLQETTDQESSPDLIIPDVPPSGDNRGWVLIPAPGSGTVTSIGMTVPSDLSVAGAPITGSGTLAITENTKAANLVKAGPASGAAATPTYRALVPVDVPHGTTATTSNLITDGDSQTSTGSDTYQGSLSFTETFTVTNVAVSGRTLKDMQDASFTSVDVLMSRNARRNIVVIWGGTNDFAAGESVAVVFDRLIAYCAARRRAGEDVIVATMISRTGTGIGGATLDSLKNTFNALILAHWAEFADGLAHLAGNAFLGADGAYSNGTYFNADAVHLIGAGNTIVAGIVSAAVNAFTDGYRYLPKLVVKDNATYLYAKTLAGVLKGMIGMNASDEVVLADTNINVRMNAGLILAGALSLTNRFTNTFPPSAANFAFDMIAGSSLNSSKVLRIAVIGNGFMIMQDGAGAVIYAFRDAGINVGAETAVPDGIVNVTVGYRIGSAAALNKILMGNGTNFVSSDPTFTTRVLATNIEETQTALTYSATPVIDMTGDGIKIITMTGNLTSMTTSNRAAGRKVMVILDPNGSIRTITAFNASWRNFSGAALPATLAVGKYFVFTLQCTDTNETGVLIAGQTQQ